jgi:hypothetical protein
MRGVSRRAGLLAIALIGLAGVAAGFSGARATTVSETADLPFDSTTHTVTAMCPQGAKATGGGIQLSDDYSDHAQGYYPAAGRGWTAAAYRGHGQWDTELTSQARCLAGAKMTTKTARGDILEDNVGYSATAVCPRETTVAGGGARLSRPDNNEPGGSYPSGPRAWTAVGRHAGGGPGGHRLRTLPQGRKDRHEVGGLRDS